MITKEELASAVRNMTVRLDPSYAESNGLEAFLTIESYTYFQGNYNLNSITYMCNGEVVCKHFRLDILSLVDRTALNSMAQEITLTYSDDGSVSIMDANTGQMIHGPINNILKLLAVMAHEHMVVGKTVR